MKLRKHLKNKRLEAINQLGIDRIIDLQFGTGEACYHVILELYDRGNVILCDYEYVILNVLRPHVEGEEIRFAVREKYPLTRARDDEGTPSIEVLKERMSQAHPGDNLRTVLNPLLPYGASLIDHCLIEHNLHQCKIGGEKPNDEATADGQKKKKKKNRKDGGDWRDFNIDQDFPILMNAINDMHSMLQHAMKEPSAGFIVQKKEVKPTQDGKEEFYFTNVEFQPFLYNQYIKDPIREFSTFVHAVDEFYSNLESQKIDLKAFQQEREALKKLSNVRHDHAQRLEELSRIQHVDRKKAELITRNQVLVDSVIYAMRQLLARQLSWLDIKDLIKERQDQKDPVASYIRQMKLETNQITLRLSDPFANLDDDDAEDEDEDQREEGEQKLETMDIDIDLGITAYSNATRYYDQKRGAAKKEQKTIEASGKALKSAEKKTQQTLKDVRIQTSISKARKVFWFEKFYWFISSENYLVIGGRDQQQNELIVKRYLRASDLYVHAEIQGASSVVIKNPSGGDIPPKTLLEAGTMAISYSVAWDAKVVTSAYWVKADQVSKTAPTGEYLSTGSFMIRGKKNFLPPCHLILGLSFLFKLEESSVDRHRGERRVKFFDDNASIVMTENEQLESIHEEEIPIESDGEDSDRNDVPSDAVGELTIEEKSAPEGSESESDTAFPDTHVKVEHTTGQVEVLADPKLERMMSEEQNEEATLIQAAPLKVKKFEKKLKQKKQPQPPPKPQEDDGKNLPKRRQKAKAKKIKEKYKDQDEEDRAMIMDILKPAGSGKDSRKTKKQEEEESYMKSAARKPQPKPKANDEMDDTPAADEVDMLDSLTGFPVDEDELLFAVPVVAPYQTLHNYK